MSTPKKKRTIAPKKTSRWSVVASAWNELSPVRKFVFGALTCFTLISGSSVAFVEDVREWLGIGGDDDHVTVPDVLELSANDARGMLDAAELEIEVVCLDPNEPGLDSGVIYKTEPRPRSEAEPHSTITVFIKPPCA